VHKAELDSEVDGLLDEIDDVLEVNAEEFVRSFVRKGGQGWTGLLLDPGFFQGAVAAGVAAIATWETFKLALTRTLKAFRHLEGPVAHMISADGTLDAGLEELVQAVGGYFRDVSLGENAVDRPPADRGTRHSNQILLAVGSSGHDVTLTHQHTIAIDIGHELQPGIADHKLWLLDVCWLLGVSRCCQDGSQRQTGEADQDLSHGRFHLYLDLVENVCLSVDRDHWAFPSSLKSVGTDFNEDLARGFGVCGDGEGLVDVLDRQHMCDHLLDLRILVE
jgi:ubiquitin-like protein Pup